MTDTTDTQSGADTADDELARLRAENADLRSQLEGGGGREGRSDRWRSVLAIVLVVLGALVLPAAVATTWIRTDLLDTDRFVDTVGPLAEDEAIQKAVSARVATLINDELDVEEALAEVVPEEVQSINPFLAGAISEVVRSVSDAIVESQEFAQLWRAAAEVSHATMVELVSGRDDGIVQVEEGQFFVPVGEIATEVADRVSERFGIDASSLLPEDVEDERLVIAQSDELAGLSSLLETLDRLNWITVIVALAALIGAVFVAPSRSKGLLWVGIGVIISSVLSLILFNVGMNSFQGGLADAGIDPAAGESFGEIVTRYLVRDFRVVFVIGLILAVIGWATGTSSSAARFRAWANRLIGRASEQAESDGALGSVSRFVSRYRNGFRIAILVLAVIVVMAWEQPTGLAVILIAVVAALLLALVAVLARAGTDSDESSDDVTIDDTGDDTGDDTAVDTGVSGDEPAEAAGDDVAETVDAS